MKLLAPMLLTTMAFVALAPATESRHRLETLSWLAGCWAGDDEGTHYEECWLHPQGGMMLGLNRTVSSNGVQYEFLRIVADDESGIAYLASPGGAPEVAFQLRSLENGVAVFSNPEHDFPQRITYVFDGADGLKARVEANQGGEWRGFELAWKRSSWVD